MENAEELLKRCICHEGAQSKVPLHPIIVMASLELLYIDYTSIEMTMELNKPLKFINVLVFQGHFTKHAMAYVTSNQTTQTIVKFLYQGYISISGALAKLLSDQRVHFMSSIIWELCELMGIKKIHTFALPCSDQWADGTYIPDYYADDLKTWQGPEGRLTQPFVRDSAGLQLYNIGCDWE